MDAFVFRAVAAELSTILPGLRLEKVFAPLPAVWTFALGRAGYLVLHTGKPVPFLFLSPHKPDNPANPSGQAMWLRKRLRNRRIVDVRSDWARRRLALQFSGDEGQWLVLDLRIPPDLAGVLPDDFGQEVLWPAPDTILSDPAIWETCPQLTPPLRRHLATLTPDAAAILLESLARDLIQGCYLVRGPGGQVQVRLWPEGQDCTWQSKVLAAAEQVYGQELGCIFQTQHGQQALSGRHLRRLERSLVRLEEDRRRLEAMRDEAQAGLVLQAHLHDLDKTAHLTSVLLPDAYGQEQLLQLRPELTLRANMERFFARAAKARRGLPLVKARKVMLEHTLDEARSGILPPLSSSSGGYSAPMADLPSKYRKIKAFVFHSSDGFFILRGRDAKANHQLLQIASPFDYWLHAQDGPGAHVIVKRDFPKQDVPEATLHEAAALAALASHLKLADRGDVLLCLVRDVRTVKGAGLGQVTVDKVLRVLRPVIDHGLEEQLRAVPLQPGPEDIGQKGRIKRGAHAG